MTSRPRSAASQHRARTTAAGRKPSTRASPARCTRTGRCAVRADRPGRHQLGHDSLGLRTDAFVRSYARQVRTYGHPVVIGFAAEMNGDWNPWGYRHTPARMFVAAWRHLVTVFRQQGAGNVIWLWTVNITDSRTGPVQDSVARGRLRHLGRHRRVLLQTRLHLRQRVPADHRRGADLHQTVRATVPSETGVGQAAGQAAKIPDLFAGVRTSHLLGLVWFDPPDAGRRPRPPGLAALGPPGRAGRIPPRAADLPGPGARRHGSGRPCPGSLGPG